MLKLSSVSKSFGGDVVLRDVSFVLNDGERIGLVGPNGAGKSTLLRIASGQLPPDKGSVWAAPADTVAYLPQYPADELSLPARESLLLGLGPVGALERRIAELEALMSAASGAELDSLLHEYAAVRERYEQLGGYGVHARLEEVAAGLELESEALDRRVDELSGGQRTKLSLARLLLSDATILLLDEPTNYLDLPALLWLERFVTRSANACIVVSHDRRFLDRTVSSVLELDHVERTVRRWTGSYTEYAESRRREEEKALAAYRDQQAEIRRVEEDIRRTREQAGATERATQHDYIRARAAKVARKAKARESRLRRMVEDPELVEKPRRSWQLDLEALGRDPIDDDRTVLRVDGLRVRYGEREVLRGVELRLHGRDRAALLGRNGSGKSTLLRAVTGSVPFEGSISLGSGVRPALLSQETDALPLDRSVLEVFRAEARMYEDEARTFLHKFLFTGEEVMRRVGALSYGQRAKLALAVLVCSDANFLMLDEPTSHMDLPSMERMEEALAEYSGPLLLVSHDRYFLERVGVNRMLVLERGQLREVESMEEYERGGAL